MRQWIALLGELLGQITGFLVFPHLLGAIEKSLGIHTAVYDSGKGGTAMGQHFVRLNVQ